MCKKMYISLFYMWDTFIASVLMNKSLLARRCILVFKLLQISLTVLFETICLYLQWRIEVHLGMIQGVLQAMTRCDIGIDTGCNRLHDIRHDTRYNTEKEHIITYLSRNCKKKLCVPVIFLIGLDRCETFSVTA